MGAAAFIEFLIMLLSVGCLSLDVNDGHISVYYLKMYGCIRDYVSPSS